MIRLLVQNEDKTIFEDEVQNLEINECSSLSLTTEGLSSVQINFEALGIKYDLTLAKEKTFKIILIKD